MNKLASPTTGGLQKQESISKTKKPTGRRTEATGFVCVCVCVFHRAGFEVNDIMNHSQLRVGKQNNQLMTSHDNMEEVKQFMAS